MNEMPDTGIRMLYRLALQEEAAGISEEQRIAIDELKRLALNENPEALQALSVLRQHPRIHPFIREMLAAGS